jgi:hypothetical protein
MIDSRVAAPRVPAELVCWAQTALLLVPPELGVADDSGLEVALFHDAVGSSRGRLCAARAAGGGVETDLSPKGLGSWPFTVTGRRRRGVLSGEIGVTTEPDWEAA